MIWLQNKTKKFLKQIILSFYFDFLLPQIWYFEKEEICPVYKEWRRIEVKWATRFG